MSIYVNEVNVVNQNEPPSSEKVVGQLMRKRFVGKALDLSRAPYSRRTKVILPECLDMVYALGDDTSHIFTWGNNDIFVYRSFWLNLLGLKEGGWLSDRHLDAWFELMWSFRLTDADWAIASSYLCGFVMRGDIPGWVCNGVRHPVIWADMEQVFFSINEPNKHYCLDVLHIRTGVISLYDSLFSEGVEINAKGIPLESYNINFAVGKDVPIQGLAYREHMFDYFWKYKIAN
ncbi:phospholipase-like protein [Tanacetum coccineum]